MRSRNWQESRCCDCDPYPGDDHARTSCCSFLSTSSILVVLLTHIFFALVFPQWLTLSGCICIGRQALHIILNNCAENDVMAFRDRMTGLQPNPTKWFLIALRRFVPWWLTIKKNEAVCSHVLNGQDPHIYINFSVAWGMKQTPTRREYAQMME